MYELLIVEAPNQDSLEGVELSETKEGQGIDDQLTTSVQSMKIYDNILVSMAALCGSLNLKLSLPKVLPLIINGLTSTTAEGLDANGNKLDNQGNVIITDFVRKTQWASMETLGSVIEGAYRYFKDELSNLMKLIIPYLQNKCHRILFSTLTTLAVLSEEYYPEVQRNYGPGILNLLASVMNDKSLPLVLRGRAVGCLVNFTRELLNNSVEDIQDEASKVEGHAPLKVNQRHVTLKEIETIFQGNFENVAGGIVTLFQEAVQISNFTLLENVLVAVSILSNIMKREFMNCYEFFSNNLKDLLSKMPVNQSEMSQQQLSLQILLIDTFSFLLSGCKEDPNQIAKVNEDFNCILNFVKNMTINLSPSDPRNKAVLSFWSVVIQSFQERFAENSDLILTSLLNIMSLKVEITMEDQENFVNKGQGFESFKIDLKAFGGEKVLSMDHSSLELKLTSFEVCYVLLKNFGKQLNDNHKSKILDLVKFSFGEISSASLKKSCFKLAKQLIKSCKQTQDQVNLFENLLPLFVNEISRYLKVGKRDEVYELGRKLISVMRTMTNAYTQVSGWQRNQNLLQANSCNDYTEVIKSQLVSLINEQTSRPILFKNFELLLHVLGQMTDFQSQMKTTIRKEYAQEVMDEDTLEEFEDEFAGANEVLQIVMEVYGEMIKFKTDHNTQSKIANLFKKIFLNLNPQLSQILSSGNVQAVTGYINADEMTYLTCFYCDTIEYLDLSIVNTWLPEIDTLCQILLKSCPQIPDLLQNIAYINNLLTARFNGSELDVTFQPTLQSRIKLLTQLDQHLSQQSDKEMFGNALDNCVSTIIRVMFLYKNTLFTESSQLTQALTPYVSRLPLRNDPIEGVILHLMLIGIFKQSQKNSAAFDSGLVSLLQNMLPGIAEQELAEAAQDKDLLVEMRLNDDTVCAVIRRVLLQVMNS